MEILFKRPYSQPPDVSVILLDWSCRESLHSLHYLNDQSVGRDRFELLWIEYYDRRDSRIKEALEKCKTEGRPPIVDQWMVLDVPKDIYYHKHLMYNVGIVASRGRIVVLCDSDAVFRRTFFQTILESFERDPNIVLHMDQVRNNDRRFYPFNFPSLEEITGPGAINFAKGTTTGLLDRDDILHTRNYGACFCALREDLIRIGGADEHVDFVGHICGPYDLTFRLRNLGKREIWHPTELLYHTWHPGQAGERNYLGPHDGKHMSTTSLSVLGNGRIQPLLENPALRTLRQGEEADLYVPVLELVLPTGDYAGWTVEALEGMSKEAALSGRRGLAFYLRHPVLAATLLWIFFKMYVRYLIMRVSRFSRRSKRLGELFAKVFKIFHFLRDTGRYLRHVIARVQSFAEEAHGKGVDEIYVYGKGPVSEVLVALRSRYSLQLCFLSDDGWSSGQNGTAHASLESALYRQGPVVLGTSVGAEEKMVRLLQLGVARERIVILQ
jgi:hypothetical protein